MEDPPEMPDEPVDFPRSASAGWGWRRSLVLATVLALAVSAWLAFRNDLALAGLAAREEQLRTYAARQPVTVAALAFAVYVAVTGLSLPLAAVLTLALGWLFTQAFGWAAGFGTAVVLVSFASTSGSTVAFLLSRYLFRRVVQDRFGERLRKFNEALKREGAFYLFTLRLIPLVPFSVVNLGMGLTPIRTRTFWWVSQLGMLPGTAVIAYTGSVIPPPSELAEQGVQGLLSWEIAVALTLLGLFPLLAKKVLQYARRRRATGSCS